MAKSALFGRVGRAAVLACLVTGAACASRASRVPSPAPPPPAVVTAWPQIYTDAIADALNPEPREVVTNLVAIVAGNPMLVWKSFPDGARVLVASLSGTPSFYPSAPGSPYNTGTHAIWVTAVPEMRQACTQPGFSRGDLAMRLRQVLGLTPTTTVTAFVEFWALPDQLFRPAADNEITDRTVGLTMPANTEPWYRTWFNQLRSHQYFQSTAPANNAYPWTQLGYTYDWGTPDHHQGMSEFVIKEQANVVMNGITPYQAYCATAAP